MPGKDYQLLISKRIHPCLIQFFRVILLSICLLQMLGTGRMLTYIFWIAAPLEKSLKIVLVKDIDGKTFWDALDEAISPRIKTASPVDESALSTFRSIFQGQSLKKGTFIFLTWMEPSRMLVSMLNKTFFPKKLLVLKVCPFIIPISPHFWFYALVKSDDWIVVCSFASHLMVCLLLWMLQSSQRMWHWPCMMYSLEILLFLLPSKLLLLMVWQQSSIKLHLKWASCFSSECSWLFFCWLNSLKFLCIHNENFIKFAKEIEGNELITPCYHLGACHSFHIKPSTPKPDKQFEVQTVFSFLFLSTLISNYWLMAYSKQRNCHLNNL